MTLQRLPRSGAVFSALAVVAFLGTPALARDNQKGKIDPALACVAAKQRAAGKYCADALRALGRFEQTGNTTRRDAAIATAAGKLEAAWTDAEATSTGAGTDCAAAFLTASAAETAIDSAGGALVGEVNTGLDVTARPA